MSDEQKATKKKEKKKARHFYKRARSIYIDNLDYKCEVSLFRLAILEWQPEKLKKHTKEKIPGEFPKEIYKYDSKKHIVEACPELLPKKKADPKKK